MSEIESKIITCGQCPESNRLTRETQYYQEDESIIIHLMVTTRCNARCKQCINRIITFENAESQTDDFLEIEPKRDSQLVVSIANKNPDKPITVCFYGGEPLLQYKKMITTTQLLDASPIGQRVRYMVYTNGELISQVYEKHPELMRKVWLYSISIDGSREQHNRVRPGTDLAKIVENLYFLQNHYHGNILVWSTLREEQSLLDCFKEFMRLYESKLANHFYWHWIEIKEPFSDFNAYYKIYTQDFESIMNEYIERLQRGQILPIAHVNELVIFLLVGKTRHHTPCRMEQQKNYDLVNGKRQLCIDLPFSEERLDPGHITDYKKGLGCYQCSAYFYCSGRCPVQVLFGDRLRTEQYCELMRLHVRIVQERIEEIDRALVHNNISLQDIYDQSAFITRYTDVVP